MNENRQAGDICESCRPRWEKKKRPGKRLIELPALTDFGLKILVCPFCDGDPIVKFANKPDNKFIPDPEEDE